MTFSLLKLGVGLTGLWMLATQVPPAMIAIIHGTATVFGGR
ncbi:MAG: hypothetical protein ACYC8W_07795 [Candidatus Tyrphobacter sp.]